MIREVDRVNSRDRALSRIGTDSYETVGVTVELFFQRNNDTLEWGLGFFPDESSNFADVSIIEGCVDLV